MKNKQREVFDLNIEIKDLPIETDHLLNTIRALRGMTKRDIIRLALVEFGENHRKEIPKLAGLTK